MLRQCWQIEILASRGGGNASMITFNNIISKQSGSEQMTKIACTGCWAVGPTRPESSLWFIQGSETRMQKDSDVLSTSHKPV